MNRTYYKVVNHELKSSQASYLEDLAIQYKIGEYVKGNSGTPLICFSRQIDAITFAKNEMGWNSKGVQRVFECECRKPYTKVYKKVHLCNGDFRKLIEKIQEFKKRHKRFNCEEIVNSLNLSTLLFPYGTEFFYEVKLIKEIVFN